MFSLCGLALLLGTLCAQVQAIDSYSSSDYIRRTGHAVAILGKRLYIDGGEIAQFHDGKTEGLATRQMNDTLSIPLDVAWTNTTVPVTSIGKAAPVFDDSALWTDQTSESMYMWGGQGPWGNLSKTRDLWKFSAKEESWKKQPAANVDVFMSFKRAAAAAKTQCNGVGFFIGGMGTIWTDPSYAPGSMLVPVPGMLTYNFASSVWANESLAGLNSYETYIAGTAACLPSFGTSGGGMVLTLGGEISRRDAYNSSEPNLIGLGNLTFWDIETKTWHSQLATGDIPSPRSKFCVVDAAGQNGTHEVFLFGGYDASNQASFQDIYVLSIPGFVWHKASVTTGGARIEQQCIIAGNRQMIIVGGRDPDLDYYQSYRDPDPWTNGINVLDVSTLVWNSQFDPDAAAYETPAGVRNWYNAGNQNTVVWTSATVKSLFVNAATGAGANSSAESGAGGSSSSSSSGTSTPVGAIVGGVIGGLGALLLVGATLWFFRRRNQKPAPNDAAPVEVAANGHEYYPTPPPFYNPHHQDKPPQELSPEGQVVMLASEERPSELDDGQWYGLEPEQIKYRNMHILQEMA